MEASTAVGLLAEAREVYRRVDSDPSGNAALAAAFAVRARDAGDDEAIVAALRAEAWAERGRLANARAKALLDEAARLARGRGLTERLGEVLVTRAAVNHELGRLKAAHDDLDAAAPLVHGEQARQRQLQEAVLHHNSGRLAEAAVLYRRLLASGDTPVDVRGKVGNNLAMIEGQRGMTEAALRCLDEAAAAATQVGPALTASLMQTRGWVLVQGGRLSAGLRLFDEASRLIQASGLPLGELHMEYGDALVDLRLIPEAAAATARAQRQFQASGVPLMGAEAQLRAARLALLSGDASAAAVSAQEAATVFRGQRRPTWAARADVVVVEASLHLDGVGPGDLRAVRHAAATLERHGMRAAASHAHLTAARTATALGRVALARNALRRTRELSRGAPVLVRLDGRIAAAMQAQLARCDADVTRHCRAGLADLARHRSALPSTELRALASGHGVELARMGVTVALRAGSPATVLQWLERTRSATLALMGPAAADGLGDERAALRAVHAELAATDPLDADRQVSLAARLREVEQRLRRATWQRASDVDPATAIAGVATLRAALDGRELVEYGVLDGKLFAVVLAGRRSRVVALGSAEEVLRHNDSLTFALRRLSRRLPETVLAPARAGAELALERLEALLLRPLGLAADGPIVIVPSAVLHGLPWAALHGGPVQLAPSASSWARTRPSTGPAASGVVLVAGPGLPGAVAEVEALSRVYPEAAVLTPPGSTVDAVAAALDGAAVAHLACHGHLRADNPMFSSLSLADGPLTVQELDSRGLAPRRIVLASCESGAQVRYDGDELLGFVSALMARGTTGIVASSVVVPDVQSVALMCSLHEQVRRGRTLGEALHAARSEVDPRDASAFVTRCAFNAYGAA